MRDNPGALIVFAVILLGGAFAFMKYTEKKNAEREAMGAPPKNDAEQLEDDLNTLRKAVLAYCDKKESRLLELQSKSQPEIYAALNIGMCRHCNAFGEWLDPWGNPMRFAFDMGGQGREEPGFGVYSLGPNGADDSRTGDDIVAWQPVLVY